MKVYLKQKQTDTDRHRQDDGHSIVSSLPASQHFAFLTRRCYFDLTRSAEDGDQEEARREVGHRGGQEATSQPMKLHECVTGVTVRSCFQQIPRLRVYSFPMKSIILLKRNSWTIKTIKASNSLCFHFKTFTGFLLWFDEPLHRIPLTFQHAGLLCGKT